MYIKKRPQILRTFSTNKLNFNLKFLFLFLKEKQYLNKHHQDFPYQKPLTPPEMLKQN